MLRLIFVLVVLSLFANNVSANRNIVYIMVDQLRWPVHMPAGLHTADQFFARFMPNLYTIWRNGVKFGNHYASSMMCAPSRGTIVTGLYSHQTYMMLTGGLPHNDYLRPNLSSAFPTYGKLLRSLGYFTPYAGKWHLSTSPTSNDSLPTYLQEYGFQGLSIPDPIGADGEGDGDAPGTFSDAQIATQALEWLQNNTENTKNTQPFALTVSFVNPHDVTAWWGGLQWEIYKAQYAALNETPPTQHHDTPDEENPPYFGNTLPANFETGEELWNNKPLAQTFLNEWFQYWLGGVSWNTSQNSTFVPEPTRCKAGAHRIMAPFYYWARGLDLYTKVISDVDAQIGRVLQYINSSQELAQNTLIVFTSDHGELHGSHGMHNKGYSAYEEEMHVPLIVYDPTGEFNGDVDTIRTQYTAHVDLVRLLVTLGNNGSSDWMTGDLEQLYGSRLDLIPILQSASNSSAGRKYIAYATDEFGYYCQPSGNLTGKVPLHITAVRSPVDKLALYSFWRTNTSVIIPSPYQMEYYDYSTSGGQMEVQNQANSSVAQQRLQYLLNTVIPDEIRAPLPVAYQKAQQNALQAYWTGILPSIGASKYA